MNPAFSRNHFDLLGLPARYAVDPARLEHGYRELQSQVHPDRFAASTEVERRVAMQWAARANEAYRTLRDPLERAIDAEANFDAGCSLVRKLRFLDKLDAEIEEALEPMTEPSSKGEFR